MTIQDKTPQRLLIAIIIAAILILFAVFIAGCTTKVHKTKSKEQTETVEKSKYDADIKVLTAELLHLQSELKQQQYAGVTFDSTKCPKHTPVFITGCNSDSINTLVAFLNTKIESYNDIIENMGNEIEILSDGTIKAKGKIRAATYSNEVAQKLVSMWSKRYDSVVAINAELETKSKTATKQVEVERTVTVFPWYFWLILVAACGATYYFAKKKLNS
jgi:hypothetical protein